MSLCPGDRDTALERYGAAGAREHVVLYGDLIFNLTERRASCSCCGRCSTTRARCRCPAVADQANIELRDFEDRERDFCRVTTGYVREGLCMNDFADVAIAEIECALDGADRCVWRATWKRRE